MKKWLVDFLCSPVCNKRLKLKSFKEKDGHIIEGVLRERSGYWYPIISGVPCFLRGSMRPDFSKFRRKYNLPKLDDKTEKNFCKDQLLTNKTFSDKWRRFRNYGLDAKHQKFLFEWYCKKLGFPSINKLKNFYKMILCNSILL